MNVLPTPEVSFELLTYHFREIWRLKLNTFTKIAYLI